MPKARVIFATSDVHVVNVKDLEVHVRLPNLAQRLKMFASSVQSMKTGNVADVEYQSLVEVVASVCIEIRPYQEHDPLDVLQGLQDFEDFYEILNGIKALSQLADDDEKKSGS